MSGWRQILRAAESWASDAPPTLTPAVRAVCLRLAEMIADARHQHLLNPEPLDPDAARALDLVATRLRAPAAMRGVESELEALSTLELRATGAWAVVPSAQSRVDVDGHRLPGATRRGAAPRRPTRSLLGGRPGGRSHRLGPGARGRAERPSAVISRKRPNTSMPVPESAGRQILLVGRVQPVVRQADAGQQHRRAGSAELRARSGSNHRPAPTRCAAPRPPRTPRSST